MEKTKKEQAEKLQAKLDKLIQSRNKKQSTFDNLKKEIADLNKNIDSVKLKLFEILQSGSDDTVFSEWAKRKISESGNAENGKSKKRENGKTENPTSANIQKPIPQNFQPQQNQKPETPPAQNNNHHDKQNQPPHTGQNACANATQNQS